MKLSFSQLARLYKYIAVIYPLVLSFIKQAEESGVSGAEKLAAVRAALEKAWTYATSLELVWDQVKPLIDAAVALYHASGIFKRKG